MERLRFTRLLREGRRIKEVFEMSAIKQEMIDYVSILPDSALLALKPLLTLLVSEEPIVETDLTDEEKKIILRGRKEYAEGKYVSLSDVLEM